MLIEQGEN